MPKDYWQPEDIGQIEENEGFPLPPVDADGKNMDYIWVPSKSLRALSAACKRMSEALVGGEVGQRSDRNIFALNRDHSRTKIITTI